MRWPAGSVAAADHPQPHASTLRDAHFIPLDLPGTIMAGSLLLLLDDGATVLDDVATMTKVAAKKTAAVLGDDLALNAKQVTGVQPAGELDVAWRVARGSVRGYGPASCRTQVRHRLIVERRAVSLRLYGGSV